MNHEDRKQRARMDDEGLKRRKRRVDIPEDFDADDFGDDYADNFVEEGQSSASEDGNLS
jgi:hypothetical protein